MTCRAAVRKPSNSFSYFKLLLLPCRSLGAGSAMMQWNAGGWFGGQIGGTAWILVAGVLAAIRDPATGLVVLLVFAIPNVIGFLLWSRRDRLSCYRATQALIVIMGIFGLAAVLVLDRNELWYAIQTGQPVSAYTTAGILAMVVVSLLISFHLRFGRSDRSNDE